MRGDPGQAVIARVFLPETGAFDAAAYNPDEPAPGAKDAGVSWAAATRSLARTFGQTVPPQAQAPALATHEEPAKDAAPASPRQFYESAWFWGGIGLAALVGGSVFFATRDTGTPTIHLEAQVPH